MMYRFLIVFLLLGWTLPAQAEIIIVNTLADADADDGQCTFHEAIEASNNDNASGLMPGECPAGNGIDTITFDVGGTIMLTQDLPLVTESVNIIGPGSGFLTIDGQDLYRFFNFFGTSTSTTETFRLQGVNLIRGINTVNSGMIKVGGDILYMDFVRVADADLLGGTGHAVHCVGGTLYMNWSRIENNGDGMGDIAVEMDRCDGEINYSLIANNSGSGLKILSHADPGPAENIDIRHSTFSGNTTSSGGGGVDIVFRGGANLFVSIRHSTLTRNIDTGSTGGGGLQISGSGGLLRLKNSVIADNSHTGSGAFVDIRDNSLTGLIITEGFNLIGDRKGAAGSQFPAGNPNGDNDYVGTDIAPLDPLLGPLVINGGPTQVHLPSIVPASPLIDRGHCTGELHDQQGRGDRTLRHRLLDLASVGNFPTSDGCDIGAAEADGEYLPLEFGAKALLSGPYIGSGGMGTNLLSVLPVGQPYNTDPWNYPGPETNASPDVAVDWVLLKLRRGAPLTPPTTAATGAAVMLEEGELANEDGESFPFLFRQAIVGPEMYYLEVDHRNHLGAMSRLPYPLTPMAGATIDLRPTGSWYGTNAVRDLGDGNEGLWGGDGDRNGDVTAFDFLNVWLLENGGPAGYTYGDFNLSSDVTAFDFLNVWLPANGQASQVP